MKKVLIILITVAFCSNAYTQALKILDLSVYPVSIVDTSGNIVDTSTISYNLDFKINSTALASSVRIMVGTNPDSGNVLDNTATFNLQGGVINILFNGVATPLVGYNATIKLNLNTTQDYDFNHITLYVTDTQGLESNRLYFAK